MAASGRKRARRLGPNDGGRWVSDDDGMGVGVGDGGAGSSRRRRQRHERWRVVQMLAAATVAIAGLIASRPVSVGAFLIPAPRPASSRAAVVRPLRAQLPFRGDGDSSPGIDGQQGGIHRSDASRGYQQRPRPQGGASGPGGGGSTRRGGGRDQGSQATKKGGRKWERSAPEEFLLVLTNLRAQFGHLDEGGAIAAAADNDPGAVERDVALIITLVRALATRQWEAGAEAASRLCDSPLLDRVLSRMVLYAATQGEGDPDLALALLSGMYAKRIDVDAFMATLVAKAAARDRRWMPVVEVCKAQLSTNPVILGTARRAGGSGRRHEGFTQALAAAVEKNKLYSSSFLVDALLQFQMVDLFTAKVALKFYRFSRTPARALPWIATAKAIGLVPDADLDFEIGRVYKALGMWREAVALLKEMVEKGRSVEDEHVGVVLSACHQAGEWRECTELLGLMKGWGLRIGRVSYLIVLRLLLEKGRVDQARAVLEQMAAQSTPLDDETARLVLFSLAKRGPVHSSLEFLRLMRAHGVTPDLITYTAALRACARFHEPDRALEVLQAMETAGIKPDMLTVSAVMEALAGAGRWDEAFALFDTARAEKGLRPDIKGWTQVLHQATQAGRWDLFPRYLEATVEDARAGTATLDLRFFATVINACAEASRTDEALAVLASVRSYGLTPNVYCYSAAAKSCLARNRWRDALQLLAEAQALGIPADLTLYRTVLRCCWQARQWKSVLQLYGEMVARGLGVDARMYHQLMDAVARAGQAELATDLLQEMAANGVEPLDATLSAFLQCWYAKGEYDKGWASLKALRRWDRDRDGEEESGDAFAPGPGAFADLMAVCAKRGDWEEVLALRGRMASFGVEASAPHLVARAYAEMGRWDEARRFMAEEMAGAASATAAEGRYPEAVWRRTYGALLSLCSKRIEPERALALLAEIQAPPRNLQPTADEYHLVMDACAQAGMTQEVRALFKALRRAQQQQQANVVDGEATMPRVESFTIMLELCAREGGKCSEASALMDDLEALGLTPDVLCLNAAMDACRDAAVGGDGEGDGGARARMTRWRQQEIMHTYNSEVAVLAARPALSAAATAAGGGARGAVLAALRLLKEMEENGIPRDTDTYNMCLEACARGGDVAAARKVFATLEGHPHAHPDVFSYVTLGCALARDGQGEEAMAVLNRMVALATAAGAGQQQKGLRKKIRWPAYYRELWPQSAKTLGKAIVALAAGSAGRCADIGRLLQFLTTHLPLVNTQAVAEQLVGKGLCTTQHIRTLTGGSLATAWASEGGGGARAASSASSSFAAALQ